MKNLTVFLNTPCLTEKSSIYRGIDLLQTWFKGADKRFVSEHLQRFVSLNRELLDFLCTTPLIEGMGNQATLCFRTNHFIGGIPLRSPYDGTQIGDLIVSPRFINNNKQDEYISIMSLLRSSVKIDVLPSLPLRSKDQFAIPSYLEAIRFVHSLFILEQKAWNKFQTKKLISENPVGNIDWTDYARRSFDPAERTSFLSRKNFLSEDHFDHRIMKYVFHLCLAEIKKTRIPVEIARGIKPKIDFIQSRMKRVQMFPSKNISIHAQDLPILRETKLLAKAFLNKTTSNATAWRANFSEIFERYVQFLFEAVAKQVGGSFIANPQFPVKSDRLSKWELAYLEPDGIFLKDGISVIIDSKYKSHLYNVNSQSSMLKTEFRYDLHQILSYSSFSTEKVKVGILCYPSDHSFAKVSEIINPISDKKFKLFMIGVPLSIKEKESTIRKLHEVIIEATNNSSS